MTITSNLMKPNTKKASRWYLYATNDQCKKQFSIRIGKSKLSAGTRKEEIIDEKEGTQDWGNVVAIENVFGYKQVLPLHEGDNLIGRRSKGTEVDIPIETNDPSMDRRHCILNVKRNKQGEIIYTLRDNDSITGTFVMNDLLGPKDRIRLEDGNVFTLGATTLINSAGVTFFATIIPFASTR